MNRTPSAAALLHVALQDLHAGKAMQAERFGAIAGAARDPALRAVLAEEIVRAGAQAKRLATLTDVGGAPENLWMKGVLDDAARDARSHQPGAILDIALVGAIRKAKAAEIVSTETALSLAAREAPAMLPALEANCEEEITTDRALRERLSVLARL